MLAIEGQLALDASPRSSVPYLGLGLYAVAVVLAIAALSSLRTTFPKPAVQVSPQLNPPTNWALVRLCAAAAVLAYVGNSGDQFRWWGVLAWLVCLGSWLLAWWPRRE